MMRPRASWLAGQKRPKEANDPRIKFLRTNTNYIMAKTFDWHETFDAYSFKSNHNREYSRQFGSHLKESRPKYHDGPDGGT